MSLAIASSKQQLDHIVTSLLHGIHDVFPPCETDGKDSNSLKKFTKGKGAWALHKDLLSFIIDDNVRHKSICLEEAWREMLLSTLHKWILMYRFDRNGIPFLEFYSIIYKIQHAFITKWTLPTTYHTIGMQPNRVYLSRNKPLVDTMHDIQALHWESTTNLMLCKELVQGSLTTSSLLMHQVLGFVE